MSRIAIPTRDAAPAATHSTLDAIHAQLGVVPNMYRLVALSPAALAGLTSLGGALSKALDVKTRERLAIATAQVNGCDYCLSAHTYLGKHAAKLDEVEMAANREGGSTDARADAAVRFAVTVVRERGHVGDADVQAVQAAGYSDGEVVEIVLHVALNTLTNYVNNVARTAIDFPVVNHRAK